MNYIKPLCYVGTKPCDWNMCDSPSKMYICMCREKCVNGDMFIYYIKEVHENVSHGFNRDQTINYFSPKGFVHE
jgi:hypothetical protein